MATMEVTRRSPVTGKINTMELDITDAQLYKYYTGALIQEAFPHLTADEREFFKTGTTAEDWDQMFGTEDDEEL